MRKTPRVRQLYPLNLRAKYPLPQLNLDAPDIDYVAKLKFFAQDSFWTWYACTFDGADIFFGLVEGVELELGSFSLSWLETLRGPLGLRVARDKYFRAIPVSMLFEKLEKERERRGR